MTYCIRKNLLYCTAVNNKTFTLKVHLKCNIICIFVLQNAKTGSRLTILLINAHILLKKMHLFTVESLESLFLHF